MNMVQELGCKSFFKMVADKDGVNFEVGGDTPCTDGKTIYMPELSSYDKEEVLGFGFHEALHIVHTDFEAANGLISRWQGIASVGLLHALYNAIEDTRIEMRGIQRYKGGAHILNGSLKKMLSKGVSFKDKSEGMLIPLWICVLGKEKFCQAPFIKDLADEGRSASVKAFGKDVVDKIETTFLNEVPTLRNTEDAGLLAFKIYSIMHESVCEQMQKQMEHQQGQVQDQGQNQSQQDQENQQGNQGQGNSSSSEKEDGSNPSKGSSNGSSEDSSKGSSGAESQDDSETDVGQNSDSQNSKKEKGEGSNSGSSNASDSSQEKQENGSKGSESSSPSAAQTSRLAKALKARKFSHELDNQLGGQLPKHNMGAPARTDEPDAKAWKTFSKMKAERFLCTPRGYNQAHDAIRDNGAKLFAEGKGAASALRTVIGGLVQTNAHSAAFLSAYGRKVNQGAITRLVAGNPKIFDRTGNPKQGVDTAVQVLVDCSGSMGQNGIHQAMVAGLGITLAMRSIKDCKAGLALFPDSSYALEPVGACECVKLAHGPVPQQEVFNIGMSQSFGGTPFTAAMAAALSELESTQETRKILLVVSDGQCGRTEALKERAKRAGVEVYALIIDEDIDEWKKFCTTELLDTSNITTPGGFGNAIRVALASFVKQGMFGKR